MKRILDNIKAGIIIIPIAFLIILISDKCSAQAKGDNTIKVHGVSFLQVCNALLDAGYIIESRDSGLQTIKTEFKTEKGKYKRMKIALLIRIKDSVAIVTGRWYNSLIIGNKFFGQDQTLDNNIEAISNTGVGCKTCFKEVSEFALSFGKPVEYAKH